MQYNGLSAFQDTQVNPEEFVEHCYQRHNCALATICWQHQHLTHYCIFRIYPENCYRKLLHKRPRQVSQDNRQHVTGLLNWKDRQNKNLGTEKQRPALYTVVADMKTLYPSLCRDTVTKALEYSLEKHSIFHIRARKIVVELNAICL